MSREKKFSAYINRGHSPVFSAVTVMTTQTDLYSLYAQTAVRFDFYASETYSESHQVASFERDGNANFILCLQNR
jgi:hypothetical protein